MRFRSLAVTAVAANLAIPSFAAATPPTREVFDGASDGVHTFCGFPVRTQTEGSFAVISFFDSSGNFVRTVEPVAGRFQTRVTNLETGKALVLHISGPGMFRLTEDGGFTFTTFGPWSVVFNPLTGQFGFFVLKGQRARIQDGDGNVSFEFHGHIVDLCAELAAP